MAASAATILNTCFSIRGEFTNAPGGISNGITSGLKDEEGIDYNLTYTQTAADNDWRWQEPWLPHSSRYIWAVAAHAGGTSK